MKHQNYNLKPLHSFHVINLEPDKFRTRKNPSTFIFSSKSSITTGFTSNTKAFLAFHKHPIATKAVIRCNVLIVGDKLTGKTTFNEHISCDDNYVVSGGYTSAVTRLKTSIGQVSLYTYDVDVIPHEFDIRYIPDNFFVGLPVDIAIIMCDTTKRSTYIGIHYWRNAIKERSPNCPIVVCGNKVDQPRYCPASDMRSMISPQPYFEISAEANYNLQKILLRLIRIHRGDNTIEFVEAPRLGLPPEPGVVVNTELQARHEAEYEASVAREAARRHGL